MINFSDSVKDLILGSKWVTNGDRREYWVLLGDGWALAWSVPLFGLN